MENTIKERVKRFCTEKNISVREFEKRCNVSNGYFNNLKNGGIAYNKMLIILESFPDLNADWLANGEGEMLRTQIQNVNGHHNTATMNGDIHQNVGSNSEMSNLLENNRDLLRQHGELIAQHTELIRQQGELIEIIKRMTAEKNSTQL